MCHVRNTLGTVLAVLAALALAGCDHAGDGGPVGVGRHPGDRVGLAR